MSKIMDHVGRDDDYRLILLTAKYVIILLIDLYSMYLPGHY